MLVGLALCEGWETQGHGHPLQGVGQQVVLQTMCRALTLGWKFASSLQKKDSPSIFLVQILIDKTGEVSLVLVVV